MLPNPLSGVQLAGKTVAEKVAMASLSLRIHKLVFQYPIVVF